ncbi:MAG TPA: Gfo/Idh/MocA family oxidoreductase [Candidatus Paceibacterota bacterium]|nr:Gfo/Idh/MocA family oxidoreductase [Verrucomicrobiota bacterium]HOX01109.1 Gfo/Idh/MocA family oxidoreductase [Verrucomicrobiota bacterium]HRZ44043.1 Gfo/Idh/MocA family oxidoreductase [Candidatus Paceibacterota bacterium]HRZ91457.1 Gfo/Idh/MocA family oxidoreductase [Candidatus Paceibacterota bacterium]
MTHQTRRSFIRTTLLGGAGAMAAPALFPSHAWAAAAKPNDRLTVGFIGMGIQSRGLLGGFLGQNTQVVAVCDVDTTRRQDAQKRVNDFYARRAGSAAAAGGCAGYNDFRELLARSDIDAVCIATPDHWHAIITLETLRAGKDVYCEKPLTHNIHEAIEVMKTVAEKGRVLQTGSMQRSSSEFRVACELVRNGAIGQVQSVECSFGPPPVPCDLGEEPLEPGLDWNRWVGPAPMRPYHSVLSPRGLHNHFPNWRNYIEFGGGMVTDWGAHHLDIAQWGLGMDSSGPVEVLPPAAKGARNGATLVYANGVSVKHGGGFGVDFQGTEGRVRVNRGRFVFDRKGKTIASYQGKEDQDTSLSQQVRKAQEEYLKDAKIKLYASQNHVGDFLACVRSRQQPIASAQVGGRTVICCHLMNLAYLHHQKIDWNPDRLQFAKGSGNPQWLTRDYRKPWQV